jgi:hypothetical protein
MHFQVVRAAQAPALARALVEGQRAALRRHGLDHIVSGEVHPDAYLVAAELESGALAGGLRLEERTPDHHLPLERAVDLPAGLLRKLEFRAAEGLMELCGVWVATPPAEPLLAERLVHLGFAVARARAMGHVVGFGAQHSLPLALRVGFHFEAEDPAFPYPTPRYESRVVWLHLPRPSP